MERKCGYEGCAGYGGVWRCSVGIVGVLPVAAAEGSEAPAPVSAPNPASTPEASILFFQDGHDAMPVNQGKKDAPNFHGGAARLATVVKDQRADGVPSDLVFGGDLGGGTLFGAVFHGEAMVDLFNKIGVDLAGFGQHDFDYGVEQTRKNVADLTVPVGIVEPHGGRPPV